jgi:DNA ligase-1
MPAHPVLPADSLFSRRRLLACVAGLAGLAGASAASARTQALPLLLAQHAPEDLDPKGYLVSEKYDGVRAHWDGRTVRFRSGLPVTAPAWFLAALPALPLDGELWMGRSRFEELSGAVRRSRPDDAAWRQIRFMVFELPGAPGSFAQRAAQIQLIAQQRGPGTPVVAVDQSTLPSRQALAQRLQLTVREGGEGLVLHQADAPYVTGRSAALLKLKPLHDAVASVVAHVPGQGKHEGRLGALRVRTPQGQEFFLGTGFSDAERQQPPPVGSQVTYTYRGTTATGLPRFASFLRRHAT